MSPAEQSSEPPEGPSDAGTESVGTVLVAGLANLAIAVAKAVGGVLSGSSAMLSEAAHSVADTVTEVLLLTALKRSGRPADDAHPLGYGRELYLWALLASVATFVGGAVFSVTDGLHTLTRGEEVGDPTLSYVILGVAFLLEGVSFLRAVRQVRGEAREFGVKPMRYLRDTPDTAVKAVTLEDAAALAGLLLAALGLLLTQLTGDPVWDACAAITIGLLLAWVAWVLGRSNASLLIGRALPEAVERAMAADLAALPQVDGVLDLVTVHQGPRNVMVAAKVDFNDLSTVADVERACENAERMLRARHPAVRRVFLDPTPSAGQSGGPGLPRTPKP